jgi:hypothetical protein
VWKEGVVTDIARSLKSLVVRLLFATAIAFAVMLLFWPYALSKPLSRPFTALLWFSHLKPEASSPYYIPGYFLIKLPEFVLSLVLLAFYLTLRALVSGRLKKDLRRSLCLSVLTLAVLLPIAYAVITRPFLYDEIRHFLFVVPPLFCLLGITFDAVVEWTDGQRLLRLVVVTLFGTYVITQVRLMAQLHPYEYAYYNQLVGGVPGAFKKGYDTEYWATSYKEAVQGLRSYLRDRDTTDFEKKKYKILVGPADWCATYYFPPNFVQTQKASEADVYLSTTREKSDTRYNGHEIVAVERLKVPFAIAKEFR